MISVNSHNLHFFCEGSGDVTFIFEAGIGANYRDWSKLQPLLKENYKVCSYDRTGYGWSDRGPKPRTVRVLADELAIAIKRLSVKKPIIIVGHSFGGLITMMFSSTHNELISGIVLLDSMHPEQNIKFKENGIDIPVSPSRALIFSGIEVLTYGIPDEFKEETFFLAKSDKTRSFMYNELRHMENSLKTVNKITDFKNPALVLTHSRRDWDVHSINGRMEDLWYELQKNLSERLNANLIMVPDAGHQMQLENPKFIANELVRFTKSINLNE